MCLWLPDDSGKVLIFLFLALGLDKLSLGVSPQLHFIQSAVCDFMKMELCPGEEPKSYIPEHLHRCFHLLLISPLLSLMKLCFIKRETRGTSQGFISAN